MLYSLVNQYKIKVVDSNEDGEGWVKSEYIPKRTVSSMLCVDVFPCKPIKGEIFESTLYKKKSPNHVSTKHVIWAANPMRKYKSAQYKLQDIWFDNVLSIDNSTSDIGWNIERISKYSRFKVRVNSFFYPDETKVGHFIRTLVYTKNCVNMHVEKHITRCGYGSYNDIDPDTFTKAEADAHFNALRKYLGL